MTEVPLAPSPCSQGEGRGEGSSSGPKIMGTPTHAKVEIRPIIFAGVTFAAMAFAWWAARGSLGLFFAGLFTTTFLTPAAALDEPSVFHSLKSLAAVAIPIALIWLIAVATTPDTITQWTEATIVLLAYSLALAGISLALARLRLPPLFATSIAITIALAWLTWPIWLPPNAGPELNHTIQHLVALNPALTINGILTAEPAWTEHSVAYHLTNLNQDIPIELPSSIAPCAALHTIIATALWLAALIKTRKSPPHRSLAA
jgi:hypothetical protein